MSALVRRGVSRAALRDILLQLYGGAHTPDLTAVTADDWLGLYATGVVARQRAAER